MLGCGKVRKRNGTCRRWWRNVTPLLTPVSSSLSANDKLRSAGEPCPPNFKTRHAPNVPVRNRDLHAFFSGALLTASNLDGRRWLPGGSALFPLVVGELLNAGAVVAHHENLAIGLRRIGVGNFILEAHPRTCKHDVLAVRRPRHVRIVPFGEGEAL